MDPPPRHVPSRCQRSTGAGELRRCLACGSGFVEFLHLRRTKARRARADGLRRYFDCFLPPRQQYLDQLRASLPEQEMIAQPAEAELGWERVCLSVLPSCCSIPGQGGSSSPRCCSCSSQQLSREGRSIFCTSCTFRSAIRELC